MNTRFSTICTIKSLFLQTSLFPPSLTSTWPHLNSDVRLEEGEYKQNCLCAIVAYCVAFQHNEQFFQVGLLDQALISLGLALSPKNLCSLSSDFMVLCKCLKNIT